MNSRVGNLPTSHPDLKKEMSIDSKKLTNTVSIDSKKPLSNKQLIDAVAGWLFLRPDKCDDISNNALQTIERIKYSIWILNF